MGADDDGALRDALLAGDEEAFERFVTAMHRTLAALARSDADVAETWRAFLERLPSWRGEPTLRIWVVGLLLERVGTPVVESSPLPTSERFLPDGHPFAGGWARPPGAITFEGAEAQQRAIAHAIDALPDVERRVMILRDVERWATADVARVLRASNDDVRAALHRARTRVQAALEAGCAARKEDP